MTNLSLPAVTEAGTGVNHKCPAREDEAEEKEEEEEGRGEEERGKERGKRGRERRRGMG